MPSTATTAPRRKSAAPPAGQSAAPLPGQTQIPDGPEPQQADGPGAPAPQAPDGPEPQQLAPRPPAPGGWTGVLAPLGRRNAEGRVLAQPEPGQPPLPALPLTLFLERPTRSTGRVAVGTVDRIWISDEPGADASLCGSGRLDLDGEYGMQVALRLAQGAVPVRADIEGDDASEAVTDYHATWTLASASVLARPVDQGALIVAVW